MKKEKNGKENGSLAWPTVQRLSEYLIILEEYIENSRAVISSSELAEIYSNTPSQVRQDIFRLPNTGRVGHGYNVKELAETIREFLGLNTKSKAVIVGCGKMGSALAEHVPFLPYGMELSHIFDVDPALIGTEVNGIEIFDVQHMEKLVKENNISLAALCVPPEAAQNTADKLVSAGINGILNFTRKRLKVPSDIFVLHQQIICSFMQLSYMTGHNPG